MMDLMVTSASELIRVIKIGGILGCSDHSLVEFSVLRDMSQRKRIVKMMNFKKAKFKLLTEVVNRIPGKWSSGTREKSELVNPERRFP